MEERISEVLKGTQFFDFGNVIFASNHPDHVYLVETKKDNELFTVIYDKKHDYLNIDKHVKDIDEEPIPSEMIELTSKQKSEIKELLEQSGNNVK